MDRRKTRDYDIKELTNESTAMQSTEFDEASFNETRAAELSMSIRNFTGSNFNIPAEKIKSGMRYAYGRDTVNGERDQARGAELHRKYWRPVPAYRHPEMCAIDIMGRRDNRMTGTENGYIYDRGLVLMERDKRFDDVEQETIRKMNRAQMASLPGLSGMGDRNYRVIDSREGVRKFNASENYFGN